jgi:alpha-tubulin suppressor-like RCC1 family protein/murein DD-endopeptidase MepM/ murein hydrolase activator NlpD
MRLRRLVLRNLVVLFVLVSTCEGLAGPLSASHSLVTPPLSGGVLKPADWPLRLPWSQSDVVSIGMGYGNALPGGGVNLKGHHLNTNSTSHPNDYYALDFEIGNDQTGDSGSVVAVAGGTVYFADWATEGWKTYGRIVLLDHGDHYGNHYYSLYAHLSEIDVSAGDTVAQGEVLGREGGSGDGIDNYWSPHLHFAIYKDCSFQLGTGSGTSRTATGPYGGNTVVPEPLVGQDVYEGFGLQWAARSGWFGSLRSVNFAQDSIPGAPSASWDSSATVNGSQVGTNQAVLFALYGLPADTKEVRLTAHYANWSQMDNSTNDAVWRILARCWPDRQQAQCQWGSSNTTLSYTWTPHQDDRESAAPWLPSGTQFVNPPYLPSGSLPVCISFDVFDQAGNVAYAPAGTRCSNNLPASAANSARKTATLDTQDNTARQVYVVAHNSVYLPLTLRTSSLKIAAGSQTTCALTANGTPLCWGHNWAGGLGDGTTTDRHTPTGVAGLTSGVNGISTGLHTCVVTASGAAKCWGFNYYGQLGDSTNIAKLTPVTVSGLASGVATIATGSNHTCAVTSSGEVKCWGQNYYGTVGDGTTTDRRSPVSVLGLGNSATAIATGFNHSCALITSGGVKCWGWNSEGQVGDGTRGNIRSTPVSVTGLTSSVTALSAGNSHTCALTTSGGVKCWGANASGQLGDGTTVVRPAPVDVQGLGSGVTAIAAGENRTCALTVNGGVKCWGSDLFGGLGRGTSGGYQTVPLDVTGLTRNVVAIAAGQWHNCALEVGGSIKCWGSNTFGELGDGTTTDRHIPVSVVGSGN